MPANNHEHSGSRGSIAVNAVLMQLRKKVLPVKSQVEIPESDRETITQEVRVEDASLSGLIDRLQLERVIDRLSPGYKMVFVLHGVEGFEHNEIASMLGCATGNSKSQLHKARFKLRKYWKGMKAKRMRRFANGRYRGKGFQL